MTTSRDMSSFFETQIANAKTHFERALDCKHTEFDDLYPYMNEHPQFFWYKRYVAWQELLTVVRLAGELEVEWKQWFTAAQVQYVECKVLEARVLDHWYQDDKQKLEEEVGADE
ncbi:hypothetical protein DFP93_11544 [Aneurinibacillus soli]|uniref:Uncharacterized protein n=1 Tax=Aneurinibacillus soli TaxID=1500254 RepID=A0A0U5B4U6_9BACL|nr:hypothetical protein [Aneurinibacillus soli]PYE59886.1 hypothetical protein DFP93_11544 [Aneurinibacillus soli]BAU29392.1 hypothetical protein CB4_03592 [Aneurinibacillus soli]